jgi:uncharacterized protein
MESFPQHEIAVEDAFSEYVFKLSSLCNMQPTTEQDASLRQLPILAQGGIIGCDQCYEYVGNSDWKHQPPFMSLEVVQQAATRIAEHAHVNKLKDVRVIAHGGEALLRDAQYLDDFATIVRKTIAKAQCNVHFSIQTNGLLLTEKKLYVLRKHGFAFGLSVDGDKKANDLHRRDRMGRSTYDRVVGAAALLDAARANWGIITVVDTANEPETTLESLAELKPRSIKLHPPHANWSAPPKQTGNISMGEWQVRAFERYRQWSRFHPDQPQPPFSLHLANDYVSAFLGASPTDERISNRHPHELFFLPNGDMQRLDTLKTTESGAYKMKFNVFDNTLNEVAKTDPGFIARRMGTTALAEECQSCEFLEQCGGDYYPLRFKQTARPLDAESDIGDFVEAFKNPSVYCADQKQFLGHIASFVERQKRLVNNIPVDIYATWRGREYTKEKYKRDHDYMLGAEMADKQEQRDLLANMSFLMGAFDNAAGLIKEPLLSYADTLYDYEVPELPMQIWGDLFDLIVHGQYAGAGALLALEKLAQHESPEQTLHFHAGSRRKELSRSLRTVNNIHASRHDAIVQAVFSPEQLLLRDMNFACEKVGQQWVVTKNAVEACARLIDVPTTSYVSPILFDQETAHALVTDQVSIDMESIIAQQALYCSPVGVTLRDLPHNLLVVDAPGKSPAEAISALRKVTQLLPQYDHPKEVQALFDEQGSAITLTPLSGVWSRLEVLIGTG